MNISEFNTQKGRWRNLTDVFESFSTCNKVNIKRKTRQHHQKIQLQIKEIGFEAYTWPLVHSWICQTWQLPQSLGIFASHVLWFFVSFHKVPCLWLKTSMSEGLEVMKSTHNMHHTGCKGWNETTPKGLPKDNGYLGGGFKYLFFLPLLGEMIQFD